MEREFLTLDNTFEDNIEEAEGMMFNIFDYEVEDEDFDPYGACASIEQIRRDAGLGDNSRALEIFNKMKAELEIEELRKKEKERLYKTDKKCYNIIEDDKKCQNKDDLKIYTRINIRKIKRLLKYNELTYDDVAKKLNTTRRTVTRKLNVQADLTANELVLISEMIDTSLDELIYKNIH